MLVYVNENIPSRRLNKFIIPDDIQIIPFEIKLRKCKWLILAIYKPPNQSHNYFLKCVMNLLDFYLACYTDYILIGDFNLQPESNSIKNILELYKCSNLVKSPTCFKSTENPSCIDLILTNRKMCFQHTKTICTGISDHHRLVYTMFKSTFSKLQPKKLQYRSFKRFSSDEFSTCLSNELRNCYNLTSFNDIFCTLLDKHAPLKTKILRGNNKAFVTKELRKAIMIRSRLKRIAERNKTPDSIRLFKQQRNYVVNLNRNIKRKYFSKIDISTNENNSLWKICKPFLSDKSGNLNERIILVENDNVIADNPTLANTLNEYFTNIITSLNIPSWDISFPCSSLDPIELAVKKYSSHPSILKIKNHFPQDGLKFQFHPVTPDDIIKIVGSMNTKKKTSGDIPTSILKTFITSFNGSLTDCINNCIFESDFPQYLKNADISPCFKKGDPTDKSNYRPISILSAISKVFEKILFEQIITYIEPMLNKLLCGFRKKYSTQHALFLLLNRWQKCIDKGGIVGSLLMDLSKAYDCIPHDLLIAKLEAYGFSRGSLKLISSYLTKRKQRVKVGSIFSEWLEIVFGVPQGSILGPLLFNIFINDLLLFILETELCNFADDNTLYACDTSLEKVLIRLTKEASNTINWFRINFMVANPAKFQLIIIGAKSNDNPYVIVDNKKVMASDTVKLLGVYIDKNLKFSEHIRHISSKARSKCFALSRIRNYLTLDSAQLIYNAFILSNFSYCPLIWMFCSKMDANKITKVQKKALQIVHNRFDLGLSQLLELDGSPEIHLRNLRFLMVEVP